MDKYMAYVAKKYPPNVSFTNKNSNYRGRFINPNAFKESGHDANNEQRLVGKTLSVWLLPAINSEIRQLLDVTPNDRVLTWHSICRAIFSWGIKGGVTHHDIHKAELHAEKVDDEAFEKAYGKNSGVARISIATKKEVIEAQNILRDGLRDLMILTSEGDGVLEYSKTYIINMIFAKFIDEKKPIDKLVIL